MPSSHCSFSWLFFFLTVLKCEFFHMILKIIFIQFRKNPIRFLIGIAQNLYINLGFGKFDSFIRKCSTHSIYYVIAQAGPGTAPHNETFGCFSREMCTHSHLVGYIKTMYSLMAVQIRHCHWMFVLVEILCHSIHGFFLFLINVECLFL